MRLPRPVRTAAVVAAAVLAMSTLHVALPLSAGDEPAGAAFGIAGDAAMSWGPVAPSRSAGILTLDWGDIDATGDAWRAEYLVLQPWESARIPGLKARNPHLKVLMYKNVAAVRKDSHGSGLYSTGLSYAEASADDWLLTDDAGRELEWSDWADLYPTDVGDPGYQDRWAGNVLAELGRADWDGVMMDDTLSYLSHPTVDDLTSVQIPTDDAMYAATETFLARVTSRVRAAGFMAVPNVTVQRSTWLDVMSAWTPYVSGWEYEHFVKWGLDRESARFAGADWEWRADMASWLAHRDVPLLAVTYSNLDDTAAQLYHRATWLLTWNGRTGASAFVPHEEHVDHWTGPATAEIGVPVEERRPVGTTGVWSRAYTHGTALVNPTSTPAFVRAPTGSHTLDGTPVVRVRVDPRSGVILRHP